MLDPNWVDTITSGPPLRLNHYMLQSREFFESVKMKRGAADVPEHYDLRILEYFQENDSIEDLPLLKKDVPVAKSMFETESLKFLNKLKKLQSSGCLLDDDDIV